MDDAVYGRVISWVIQAALVEPDVWYHVQVSSFDEIDEDGDEHVNITCDARPFARPNKPLSPA